MTNISLDTTTKQKNHCQRRESNPGPLAPQSDAVFLKPPIHLKVLIEI